MQLTGHSASTSAATMVIDDYGIALDNSISSEVAAEAGIRDLSVLKDLDRYFDSVNRAATASQDGHGSSRRTVNPSIWERDM